MRMPAPSLIALAAAIACAGCLGASSTGAPAADVSATDHLFTPLVLDVGVGDTVVWQNDGKAPHTVSIPADERSYMFDEEFEAGQRVSYTFTEPAEYDVVCIYHPGMDMVVRVA